MEKKRRNDYIGIKTTSLCRYGVEDFNLYLHYQNIDSKTRIFGIGPIRKQRKKKCNKYQGR